MGRLFDESPLSGMCMTSAVRWGLLPDTLLTLLPTGLPPTVRPGFAPFVGLFDADILDG